MTSLAPCFGQETDQSRPDPLPFSQAPVARPIEIQCLCPFCGAFNSGIGKPCSHCEMEDTTATRDATRQRSGLWFVMPPGGPASEPMNFDSLLAMVQRKLIIPRSVVRGPTTGQLWRLASKIRGLSREFGLCYACGGDIDTDETVCPHCDRVQTAQEPIEPVSPAPVAAPVMTERQALLLEPKITVHSLNDHSEVTPDPIAAARPVVAERSEHRIPKDDLLTPRDLAKAFQLEFNMPEKNERYLYPSSQTVRKIKVALTSVAALGVAFALVWPLINVVPQWVNANSAKAGTPAAAVAKTSPAAVADARLASDLAFSSPEIVPSVMPAQAAPTVPAATLHPAAPAIVLMIEPTPVVSAEDDPTLLWRTGMEAESAHNYAAAVAAYERIESLPSTMWPAHLETRLMLARKELKGDIH